MDLEIKLNEIDYDELLNSYSKTKEFISYLDNEIETVEVEKKAK